MDDTLNRIQDEAREWVKKNFGDQPPHQPLLGVVEEVGELSHAMLKYEAGIRGYDIVTFTEEGMDAVGDILIYLMNFCNVLGWNMKTVLERTWDKVSKRDWAGDPENGGTSPTVGYVDVVESEDRNLMCLYHKGAVEIRREMTTHTWNWRCSCCGFSGRGGFALETDAAIDYALIRAVLETVREDFGTGSE